MFSAILPTTKPSFSERITVLAGEPSEVYTGKNLSWDALRSLSVKGFMVGYLSYDLAEDMLGLGRGRGPLPRFWFGLYDNLTVKDEITGKWFIWHLDGSKEPWPALSLPAGGNFRIWLRDFDQSAENYTRTIRKMKEEIANGHYYQANYTIRARFGFSGSPLGLFRALLRKQPVPYGAYLDTGSGLVISGSPELFLRVNNRTATTKPMKGTLARGSGGRQRLFRSEKDRAENLMIADIARHDLGRISDCVRVKRLFRVENYATVYQMVSVIEADLSPGKDAWDAVESCFPPASVTGAPKSSATEAIARHEASPRGVYTGIIGYTAPWGDACFSVAIRTCELLGDLLLYGTGGGITFASEPESEWQECMTKMAALEGL
ncbi:MAG: anthranilate synthase component I family protein [candidate division WOR-3 bacterium]